MYDYRALSPKYVATLVCGLRENSRTMMALSGAKVEPIYLMLALVIDRLSLLVWENTEDARKGRNKPQMLSDLFTDQKRESGGEYYKFSSGEEFERMRQKILREASENA